MASDVKAISQLAMVAKDYCSNSFRVAAESSGSRKRVNSNEGKPLMTVSSAEPLQVKVSTIGTKQDPYSGKVQRARSGGLVHARLGWRSKESLRMCGGAGRSVQDEGTKNAS